MLHGLNLCMRMQYYLLRSDPIDPSADWSIVSIS